MNKLIAIIVSLFIGFVCAYLFFIFNPFGKGIQIDTNRTAVIKQLQKLNRLETASFTIEKIVEAGAQGNQVEQFLFGDKILVIANGQIIAGVDLSKITDKDISVQGKSLTLKLPSPEILQSILNNDKTIIYNRQTGILTKGNKDLETQARSAAEKSIRTAACDGNILETARENAIKQLTALFESVGFTSVTVEMPIGSCSNT